MPDPRIPFKNRWLAGVLAFLIPGGGHLYQGRWFKGILYGLSIVGTFCIGMHLGDWSVVYWKKDPTNLLNPFYAQAFVGLPALPALIQSRRYASQDNRKLMALDAPLTASFQGKLTLQDRSSSLAEGTLDGTISVAPNVDPHHGQGVVGQFTGTLTAADGKRENVKDLPLGGPVSFDKPVSADPAREFECYVTEGSGEEARLVGRLKGDVPRSFWNRFEAPPDEEFYLELHRRLGKYYELALTFTMIAGLLNILVILDAVEGPAYGYGDAEEESDAEPADAKSQATQSQATQSQATLKSQAEPKSAAARKQPSAAAAKAAINPPKVAGKTS